MSILTTLLLSVLSLGAFGETIFIQSSAVSHEDFKELVFQLRGVSVVEYFKTKYSSHSSSDFQYSENLSEIQKQIEQIESQPLLKGDCEILIGLYQRLFHLNQNLVPIARVAGLFSSQPELQDYYQSFWKQLEPKIKVKTISTEHVVQLNRILQNDLLVLVDGVVYDKENIHSIGALPHQWILFSNSSIPILYRGSINGFFTAIQTPQKPSGRCLQEYSPFRGKSKLKLTLLNEDPSCLEILRKSPNVKAQAQEKSFYQANKTWIIPTAIIAGLVTYNYLQDKKIIIKLPQINF